MDIPRIARAAAVAASVGISALTFGIGPVSADPPPPPAPGGPAMGTSVPATTNVIRPGAGPGGAHGGQNETQAPKS
jgi:hypothetical protein